MIIFRADGNSVIGAGHIMRCLSIANAAKEKGETCKFILATDDFKETIIGNGHSAEVLNSDYTKVDTKEIIELISKEKPSAVIADSYFVTENDMNVLRQYCNEIGSKLVYIDDRCCCAFPCDILVNYNVSADKDSYNKLYENTTKPVFLLGTEYAPLRKEFQDQEDRVVIKEGKNILVSTGGADSDHFTLSLINEAAKYNDYNFHFVVGMMNRDKTEIRKLASEYRNIIIHENVAQMGKLMRSCDAAVSASGSTLYELCATQTPTITYVLADNQIPLANGFSDRDIIKYYGDIRVIGKDKLANILICEIVKLADDYEQRKHIAETMAVVDGNGAGRIIDRILN